VATVVHSARALSHLERAIDDLRERDAEAAISAAGAVRSAVGILSEHPLLGRRIHGDIRELVISYGRTGYLALYRYVVPRDEVRILAVRPQREIGFVP
jgi:plasmid stabilization system protein ParE